MGERGLSDWEGDKGYGGGGNEGEKELGRVGARGSRDWRGRRFKGRGSG